MPILEKNVHLFLPPLANTCLPLVVIKGPASINRPFRDHKVQGGDVLYGKKHAFFRTQIFNFCRKLNVIYMLILGKSLGIKVFFMSTWWFMRMARGHSSSSRTYSRVVPPPTTLPAPPSSGMVRLDWTKQNWPASPIKKRELFVYQFRVPIC